MSINDLIVIYGIYYASLLLHELCHLITGLIFKLDIVRFKIGDDFFAINIKKASISPIAISGYVEYIEDDMEKMSLTQQIIFFISGPALNLVLVIVSLFNLQNRYFDMVLICNLFIILLSMNPFNKKSDLLKTIVAIKKNHASA